jgi:hypothetical protein
VDRGTAIPIHSNIFIGDISMIIYQITNLVNNKFYIGKTTKTAEQRLQRHFYNAKSGQTNLYRAIRKYGKEFFTISIIEETENLNEREMYWIQILKPHYNMTRGGDGAPGISHSPNFKKAMQEYHSKLNPQDYATYGMLGKSQSENAKQKISKANSYPVVCDGVKYSSIKEAQLAYPGISVRKRLASAKYPNFYRLRPKRVFKTENVN